MSNEDLGVVAAVALAIALHVFGFRVLRAVALDDGFEWVASQYRSELIPLVERGIIWPPEDVQ